MELIEKGKLCKNASFLLSQKSNDEKNNALIHICNQLNKQRNFIIEANKEDIKNAKTKGKTDAFIDRLMLDEDRLHQIIVGVRQLTTLPDPCNIILDEWQQNDLHFIKKSVPIGVIAIIYEARPNVSVDAAVLCLKSSNVCFLRGSSDTIQTNKALVKAMQDGLKDADFNIHCIELLEDTSHESATKFMRLNEYIDLLIPRGGRELIKTALNNASIPIIETGTGNCHIYVDEFADIKKAVAIIINAKTQRISVCNACESLLIHENIKASALPEIITELKKYNVKIHGCKLTQPYDSEIIEANDEDYSKEYLDYEISIKIVPTLEAAINHINHYSTQHSDCIISENQLNIQTFLNQIDSAVVYANASSRFSDGFEFGFGAEIGISTQKIHARGPMGLKELTSYKYQVCGNGTLRK